MVTRDLHQALDDDLSCRVNSFLATRQFSQFRNLSVTVHHGAVTISGKLESFYAKQVALNSCQRVAGVLELIDDIVVQQIDDEQIDDQNEESITIKVSVR